jgi:hypothetical protein
MITRLNSHAIAARPNNSEATMIYARFFHLSSLGHLFTFVHTKPGALRLLHSLTINLFIKVSDYCFIHVKKR